MAKAVNTTTTTTVSQTTTTTTIKQQLIDLQSFLDTKRLSRAEKMYYQKTYGQEYKTMTYKEWSDLTKLV